MLVSTFLAIAFGCSLIPAYLFGLHRFLIRCLILSGLELVAFWIGAIVTIRNQSAYDTFFGNVYLSGASVDLFGMTGLLLVWSTIYVLQGLQGDKLILGGEEMPQTTYTPRQLAAIHIVLLWVVTLAGGTSSVSLIMFLALYDQREKTISQPRSRLLEGLGFLVIVPTVVMWAYFTAKTPSLSGLETLWEAFNANAVTMHIFYVIFIGSWFIMPIILTLPRQTFAEVTWPPWLQVSLEVAAKLLLVVIALLNITVIYWVLWLLAMSPSKGVQRQGLSPSRASSNIQ